MIHDFVMAWDANKNNLRDYLLSHPARVCDRYEKLVLLLFDKVINPYLAEHGKEVFCTDCAREIDFGTFQGMLMYLLYKGKYEPSCSDIVFTYVFYGSCDICDLLQSILPWDRDKMLARHRVDKLMNLCLHILQRCKMPYNTDDFGFDPDSWWFDEN